MKKEIHPKWYKQAKVTCNCGNTFTIGSTLPEVQVEICSSCHPFFTGELKYVDTQGRVEKFQKKQETAEKTKLKKKKKQMRKRPVRPQTLREMLTKDEK